MKKVEAKRGELYVRFFENGETFGISDPEILRALRAVRIASDILFNDEALEDREDEAVFVKVRYGILFEGLLEVVAGYAYEYADLYTYDELFNEDGTLRSDFEVTENPRTGEPL